MRAIPLLFIGLIGLLSCKKEKIVEVERQTAWKTVTGFDFDERIATNSGVSGDSLYITNKYLGVIVPGHAQNTVANILQSDLYADRQYPIGKYYMMGIQGDNSIVLTNLKFPLFNYSIFPRSYDTTFGAFDHWKYSVSPIPSAVINAKDDLLTFYKTKDSKTRILFVSVKPDPFGFTIDTFFTKKIDITSPIFNSNPRLFGHQDYFLAFYADGIYKILSDGSYAKKYTFTSFPMNCFAAGDSIYAVSENHVYFSSDKGEAWSVKYNSTYQMSNIKVYHINNMFIGSYAGQLFHIQLSDAELNYKELVNDGLEKSVVTSVSYFDNKYYVTTNSGVFYRDKNDFLSYK